jgi:endonuclease/exonuclease/phosphatase family metal-dependent hydrolase
MFRIATFNLEKLDREHTSKARLEQRIAILRPQLMRLEADILCFQEVDGRRAESEHHDLDPLSQLIRGTEYARYTCLASGRTGDAATADLGRLAILSRCPIENFEVVRHRFIESPLYRKATAQPAEAFSQPVGWDRPLVRAEITLPGGRRLTVVNMHLRAPTATPIAGQKQSAWVWNSTKGWAEGYYLSAIKRAGQALEARMVVDGVFDADPEALIAVCGDLNARVEEVPTRLLLAAGGHGQRRTGAAHPDPARALGARRSPLHRTPPWPPGDLRSHSRQPPAIRAVPRYGNP